MTQKALYPELPLLLVDDEEAWLRSFSLLLRSSGISNIRTCADSRKVIPMLSEETFCAIVLDLIMPNVNGEELLEQIVAEQNYSPVIILTGLDQVEAAVRCMKKGAYDFFTKVTEEQQLLAGIRRAIIRTVVYHEHLVGSLCQFPHQPGQQPGQESLSVPGRDDHCDAVG